MENMMIYLQKNAIKTQFVLLFRPILFDDVHLYFIRVSFLFAFIWDLLMSFGLQIHNSIVQW